MCFRVLYITAQRETRLIIAMTAHRVKAYSSFNRRGMLVYLSSLRRHTKTRVCPLLNISSASYSNANHSPPTPTPADAVAEAHDYSKLSGEYHPSQTLRLLVYHPSRSSQRHIKDRAWDNRVFHETQDSPRFTQKVGAFPIRTSTPAYRTR